MWKKCLAALGAAVVLSLGISGMALAAEDDSTRFVDGTMINNVSVSALTVDEAKDYLEQYYRENYSLRIRDTEGNEYVLHGSQIGFIGQVVDDLAPILQSENESGRESGPGGGNNFKAAVKSSYDEGLLKDFLAGLPFVKDATPTSDAYITDYVEGEPFQIIPEVQGTEIDMDKFVPVVKAALDEQRTLLRIDDTDSYKTIKVRADDPELNALLEKLNQYGKMEITYVFGEDTYTLTGEAIVTMVTGTENGEPVVDRDKAAAYIAAIANLYDTYGKPHAFHTTAGKDIVLSNNVRYGWRMNQAAETDMLVAMIKTGQSQRREPLYLNSANSRSGNDYGNTYVEVDMANQQLFLYENGVCLVGTPIVTGNVSAGNGTPTGIYYVYSKERNRVLRGARRADGSYSYESPVSYWMPFNGGIGLHDANWRGSFGGSIYRTSGSHGCVNMPPKITPAVWEHVYVGIPVICHYNE